MSEGTINIGDKSKVKEIIEKGIRLQQEINDLREDLNDEVKRVAQEINIKPGLLKKAIRVAFKSSLDSARTEVDDLGELLEAAGRA